MTWEQFEGQLDNPVMEATNRTRQRQSGDDRLQYDSYVISVNICTDKDSIHKVIYIYIIR